MYGEGGGVVNHKCIWTSHGMFESSQIYDELNMNQLWAAGFEAK